LYAVEQAVQAAAEPDKQGAEDARDDPTDDQ
jgi:hypothetical protein